jgi:spore coat polysaccharide biosynthesis predicted glycosyltransferase SpsG
MIYTITFSILCLVGLNFLLLKFSSNTTSTNKKVNKKPIVLSTRVTSLQDPQELAPTGS